MNAGGVQLEAAYPGVLNIGTGKGIPDGQRIGRRELIIHSRAEPDTALRNTEHLAVGVHNRERCRIENRSIDNRAVIDRSAIYREKEGGSFPERPLQAAAVLFQQKGRFLGGIRVARIPHAVTEVVVAGSMKLVCSRLR